MDARAFFIILFLLIFSAYTRGQGQGLKTGDTLYAQIAHMDSVMFNAFNNRDLKTFAGLFAEDLEFYHDKGGLTGYRHTIDFMQSVAKNDNGLKRELLPGTLEIYPIKDYGAIETGSHRFCHQENGRQDCGSFKFVHIWKKTGNEWKVTRIISYDH